MVNRVIYPRLSLFPIFPRTGIFTPTGHLVNRTMSSGSGGSRTSGLLEPDEARKLLKTEYWQNPDKYPETP